MYQRLARMNRYAWWKPLVELVVFVLLVVALWLVAIPSIDAAVGPAQDGAAGIIKLALAITKLNADIRWGSSLVDVTLNVLHGIVIAKLYSGQVRALGERAVEPVPRLGG